MSPLQFLTNNVPGLNHESSLLLLRRKRLREVLEPPLLTGESLGGEVVLGVGPAGGGGATGGGQRRLSGTGGGGSGPQNPMEFADFTMEFGPARTGLNRTGTNRTGSNRTGTKRSEARGGGSTSGGHVTGHQVDAGVVGVEGTLFHCTTEGGSGGVQADAATLFSDFGSPNQMEQVFGAGSEFFADFAQFGSPAGDYRPQFDGVTVDLNVDLNEVPTGYHGGEFALGGTPASAIGVLRQHPPPVEPEPADAADSRPPDAFVPVTQRRKRVIKPAKCGT
ncbi:hypothetical protein HN873_047406, partial [Arachis hypogaea]